MIMHTRKIFYKSPHRLVKITEPTRRSRATLIDGKAIAENIFKHLRKEVEEFKSKYSRTPSLTAILVGENAASKLYVKNKMKAADTIGIKASVITLPTSIEQADLTEKIHCLNDDVEIDSILLQLPLPAHINKHVCDEISPAKDVDGFTSSNLGKFYLNFEAFMPCTALAIHRIMKEIKIDITGKNTLICGRSKHVSLPIAMLLHSNSEEFGFNTSTTICHRLTPPQELTNFCRHADIVITATGVPSLIRGHMVKRGAVIIDVGITRITQNESGKSRIVGDVNFEEVVEVAGFITPVPGGVGPLTVAMLMQNTIKAAKRLIR